MPWTEACQRRPPGAVWPRVNRHRRRAARRDLGGLGVASGAERAPGPWTDVSREVRCPVRAARRADPSHGTGCRGAPHPQSVKLPGSPRVRPHAPRRWLPAPPASAADPAGSPRLLPPRRRRLRLHLSASPWFARFPGLCCHSGDPSSPPASWRHSALSPGGFRVSLFAFPSFTPLTCKVAGDCGARRGLASAAEGAVSPAPRARRPARRPPRLRVGTSASPASAWLFSSPMDRAVAAPTATCEPNSWLGVALTDLPGLWGVRN